MEFLDHHDPEMGRFLPQSKVGAVAAEIVHHSHVLWMGVRMKERPYPLGVGIVVSVGILTDKYGS